MSAPANRGASAKSQLPAHIVATEPTLTFAPGPGAPSSVHPLLGLLRYGPYALPPHGSDVRIATVTAVGQQQRLFGFLSGLRDRHEPTDRPSYLPLYPGFASVMKVDVIPAAGCHFELPDVEPADQDELLRSLAMAVSELHVQRDHWDVIAFLLPERWESLRDSPDGRYRLHDRLKALAAPLGCPIQMLRETSALSFVHYASLAWRLSIALLAKAGGVPWRIEPTSAVETAYIGLAYAIRGGSTNQFITCCSQVMGSDGGGMEFVAYNVGAARDLENPHLTRDEMRAVMSRSAQLYQHRRAGHLPRRLTVHKKLRWRPEEIQGVLDAWGPTIEVECVSIQTDPPWRAAELVADPADKLPSVPAGWPLRRGTFVQMSPHGGLLWLTGTAPTLSVRGSQYNPSVKGIPTPVFLTRDAGQGPLDLMIADAMALSKMNWNNDAPFDGEPVTIRYSANLAKVIGHVPSLPDDVYQYRLFM
jgi:hypothetical protein